MLQCLGLFTNKEENPGSTEKGQGKDVKGHFLELNVQVLCRTSLYL